jgi:hypothetical protein
MLNLQDFNLLDLQGLQDDAEYDSIAEWEDEVPEMEDLATVKGAPGCWLKTYGRGVGKPLSTCSSSQEKNGLLCYPKCNTGYVGNGPVCWQ